MYLEYHAERGTCAARHISELAAAGLPEPAGPSRPAVAISPAAALAPGVASVMAGAAAFMLLP
jgi:hypothetical protein